MRRRLARLTRRLTRSYLFYTVTVYAIGVATGATWYAVLA